MGVTFKNPTAVYDALQLRFGVGHYDEGVSAQPYHKMKMTEAGKINRMMATRKVSLEDLALAFDYAIEHHSPLTASWELFELVLPAKKQARERKEIQAATDVRERLLDAAGRAADAGQIDWSQRLYTASPEMADAVLAEWEATQ